MKIAVLGGGAAGFFSAISCKSHHPDYDVTLYERSSKLLTKVKVSGGGRCNVSNATFNIAELSKNYPRGERQLKKAFSIFSTVDTIHWFESRGVKLKTEPDNRIFPVTNNSQTIIDCLMNEAERMGINIQMNFPIDDIEKNEQGFNLNRNIFADKVIVATGGSTKLDGFKWLAKLNHAIESPVPSLFTFNIPNNSVTELMGVSVEHATVKIQGTKLKQAGPLLITHWGMSGPAVLKLSALGARVLNEMSYHFKINVNWCGGLNEEQVREALEDDELKRIKISRGLLRSSSEEVTIPSRLRLYLVAKAGIDPELKWNEISKEKFNRLIAILTADEYTIEGKTTFKEEFVTCGGVSLKNINFNSMESNVCSGLYFAGEVIDVDGITGGFNFQAAWTTGFIAGMLR